MGEGMTSVGTENLRASENTITYNRTNINGTTESIYNSTADTARGEYPSLQEADRQLPKSLFYQYTEGENGAISGLFNYYLLGKQGNGNDKNGMYKRSERRTNNRKISFDSNTVTSRNPTAKNIIDATTTSGAFLSPQSDYVGQPYDVKDFIFCRHYGVVPNNRMITLRRFPTPILDNLNLPFSSYFPGLDKDGTIIATNSPGISSQQMARDGINIPLAQAVTYFGKGTANPLLNSILQFSTGLKWQSKSQDELVNYTKNDPGFYNGFSGIFGSVFNQDINDLLQSANRVGGTLLEPKNIEAQYARKMYDVLRERGPLRERIFADMNTVNQMYTRGVGITGGFTNFTLVFEYDLTSVGEANSKLLFLDLLANLLAIGTDYGKFLIPQILEDPKTLGFSFPGGPKGYTKFLSDPVMWIADVLQDKDSAESKAKRKQYGKESEELIASFKQFKDTGNITKGGKLYNALTTLLTEKMIDKIMFEPLVLTGYPTGDWHMVVGNPLNPIAMVGNLICKEVKIEFGEELGPDDFPTSMKATYTLAPARARHRGDFESMFNRGHGRLYLGQLPETSYTTGRSTISGKPVPETGSVSLNTLPQNYAATAEIGQKNN